MSDSLNSPTYTGASGQPLLSANTTLLQPGSGFFRLYDVLWLATQGADNSALGQQLANLQSTVTSMQAQLSDVNNQIDSLQGQINTLNTQVYNLNTAIGTINGQIGTINARLTAAGIP